VISDQRSAIRKRVLPARTRNIRFKHNHKPVILSPRSLRAKDLSGNAEQSSAIREERFSPPIADS
jgi:hypothetical protein